MQMIDLKKNTGGLNDIEYIAHYLVLSKKKQSLNIIGKSIPEILKGFKVNKKVLNELSDNYIFLKKLEIFNQLAFNSSSSKISDDENRYKNISRLMKIKNGHTLKTKLNSVMKVNGPTESVKNISDSTCVRMMVLNLKNLLNLKKLKKKLWAIM